MVERLLEAGRVVLHRDGYEGFTTNRVAREAGVSPGSLYQYFADKGAIVAAIIECWSDEVEEAAASGLAARLGEEGPAMVHAVADALLAALETSPALLRVVMEELPPREHRARLTAFERRVVDLVTAYLAARPGTSGPDRSPARIAWVLVMAVENLTVRYVLDDPPLTRADFLDEVTALCAGYLWPGPADPGRADPGRADLGRAGPRQQDPRARANP